MNHPMPKRKGWDGRRAAPYAGPDPIELSRQRAEAEASGGGAKSLPEESFAAESNEQGRGGAA